MIRYSFLVASLGLTACGSQPAAPPAPPPVADPLSTVVAVATPTLPAAPAAQPPKADPPGFEFPPDLGGRAVARAVAPRLPDLKPAERFGTVPASRTPPVRVVFPERVEKAVVFPQPILPPKPADLTLRVPGERVPILLGAGADAVPQKPVLPVAPGLTERARDVNLPPALPVLGRPPVDRVGFDDPTVEFGHAVIVGPVVKVPAATVGFLRVTLPDPFELGGQVKPRVPPAADPGLTPVPVNPQRVK